MPEKTINTLTLNIIKLIYIIISFIIFYKLYSVIIPGYLKYL